MYVNYESMPGCLALLPLREAVEVHAGSIEGDDLIKTQSSLDYLDFIAQKKAPFFIDNPMAGKFVDDMKKITNNDLYIKLMHK